MPRSVASERGRPAVTRRAVLGGVTSAAAATLAGCSKKRSQQLKPRPDVAVLLAAITAEERLVALYESTLASHRDLAQRIDPLLAHHRDHLAALRRHYVPGTATEGPPPSPATGATGAAAAPVSKSRRQAVAALRTAERQAASARLADVTWVTPGMAQLFASIGACEAGHATWLARLV